MQASVVAKVGGGAIRGDDTFRHLADCWCVVGCVPDGGVAHVPVVDHDVNLPQQSGVHWKRICSDASEPICVTDRFMHDRFGRNQSVHKKHNLVNQSLHPCTNQCTMTGHIKLTFVSNAQCLRCGPNVFDVEPMCASPQPMCALNTFGSILNHGYFQIPTKTMVTGTGH